jgi:hypothetical protein
MNLLQSLYRDPNKGESVEETLARLKSGAPVVTDQHLLQPPRPLRLLRLAFSALLIVIGVGTLLGYQETDELEGWNERVWGAPAVVFGALLLLENIRNRVLLSPDGVTVRRIFGERTIPWTEVSQIDQFCDHDREDGDQYGLSLTTTSGDSIRLPGFSTFRALPHTQLTPSLVASANEIDVWRRRYDPTASSKPHAPAGWYPDVTNDGCLRYWDGKAWTNHLADGGAAPTSDPDGSQSEGS